MFISFTGWLVYFFWLVQFGNMGYCFNLSVDHLSGSYCPGGPDSDFEYSTQSYTGYEVRGKYSLQYYIYLRTFFPVFYFFVKVNYRLFLAGVYFKHVIFLLCHIYICVCIYFFFFLRFSRLSWQPTSMRAIRARYDPYLQTRHRVEQVRVISWYKVRINVFLSKSSFIL